MDAYTISDLARQTGLTQSKVKTALKDVEPTHVLNNGYYKLYSMESFRSALVTQNEDVLRALGWFDEAEAAQEEQVEETYA